MKKSARIMLPVAATMLAAITGYLVAQEKEEPAPTPLIIETDSRPIERVGGAHPTSYAPMLAKARQSVVSVHTAEFVQYARRSGSQQDELLRQLFGARPQSPQAQDSTQEPRKIPQGAGSGVIISADGYILTNNHVVQDQRGGDADEILVHLSDDTQLEAKLIGRDPRTDIAVIKVEATDLPFLKLADSDEVMVGDIVFAIGNPLGIGLTVTSGIVSATDRSIGIYGRDGFESFIQTDASINQGNSGGALVDIEGRLIGVNSAIASNSGGSIGLGFAIPTNLASRMAEKLTQSGEIKRGMLGIRMSELDPSVAEAMGVADARGVLVEESIEGYPAKEAGVRHGDIIVAIGKNDISGLKDISLEMHKAVLGETLTITVLRDKEEMSFDVKLADPQDEVVAGNGFVEGVKAATLNDELRKSYNIPSEVSGVVITEASQNSPFARYLKPGLVILEINRQSVDSFSQAKTLLVDRGNNLLYVYADGRTSYFAMRLN